MERSAPSDPHADPGGPSAPPAADSEAGRRQQIRPILSALAEHGYDVEIILERGMTRIRGHKRLFVVKDGIIQQTAEHAGKDDIDLAFGDDDDWPDPPF